MNRVNSNIYRREGPSGTEIHNYLMSRKADFVDFLRDLTLTESPSILPEPQERARQIIVERLEANAFRTLKLSGHKNGVSLFARPCKRERQAPLQLLLGHYDTVWPIG